MMKRNHTPLTATAAIVAALALAPTPLLAQAVEIPTDTVIIAPQTTTPAAPPPIDQPTVVAPAATPQTAPPPTMTTTPKPTTSTTTTTERTTTTTRATPSTRAAAPAPAPRARAAAPAAAAPSTADTVPAPVVDETVTAPIAPIASSEPVTEPEAAPSTAPGGGDAVMFGIMVLAAIAALVLAIWGFIAIGRRRPVARRAATPVVERPKIQHPAPIHAETAREPEPETTSFAAPATPTPINTVAPAPSMAHTGAAVPLPRTMPATFEERDALMRRMIAAKPDRANPFKSPIQRYHRAKLIMQSLGRDFGDTEPWIDLSQYPQNWPELQRRHVAA